MMFLISGHSCLHAVLFAFSILFLTSFLRTNTQDDERWLFALLYDVLSMQRACSLSTIELQITPPSHQPTHPSVRIYMAHAVSLVAAVTGMCR